jgi:hypothetical protein
MQEHECVQGTKRPKKCWADASQGASRQPNVPWKWRAYMSTQADEHAQDVSEARVASRLSGMDKELFQLRASLRAGDVGATTWPGRMPMDHGHMV